MKCVYWIKIFIKFAPRTAFSSFNVSRICPHNISPLRKTLLGLSNVIMHLLFAIIQLFDLRHYVTKIYLHFLLVSTLTLNITNKTSIRIVNVLSYNELSKNTQKFVGGFFCPFRSR